MIHIEYLADHPTYAVEIAQIKYDHWKHTAPERPYDVWIGEIEHSAQKNVLPVTLVTLQDSELVGFVTLVEFVERAGIRNGAWMITLYVKEQYRGAGHGRRLTSVAFNWPITWVTQRYIYGQIRPA